MNRQEKRRLNRTKTRLPSNLGNAVELEIKNYFEEERKKAGVQFIAVALETLHDEFGFGDVRLQRFADRLILKLEAINAGYASYKDLIENLNIKEK